MSDTKNTGPFDEYAGMIQSEVRSMIEHGLEQFRQGSMGRLGVANSVDAFLMSQLADLLEERGRPDIAFAYRWMHATNTAPAFRGWKRVRKPWAWFTDRPSTMAALGQDNDAELWKRNVFCHLELPMFVALEKGSGMYQALYTTWDEAVEDLAQALEWMRETLDIS